MMRIFLRTLCCLVFPPLPVPFFALDTPHRLVALADALSDMVDRFSSSSSSSQQFYHWALLWRQWYYQDDSFQKLVITRTSKTLPSHIHYIN
jgi:hypothetical protein